MHTAKLSIGTGFVQRDEFISLVLKKMQDDEDERELKDIFRVLDKEKKGEVNTNELRWILKNLGDDLTEEDIDDMIADVDTDGSGWVDYDGTYATASTEHAQTYTVHDVMITWS